MAVQVGEMTIQVGEMSPGEVRWHYRQMALQAGVSR